MMWPSDDPGIITQIVFPNEGRLVNNPADPGGITNRGVTKPALAAFRGCPVTDQDIIDLTDQEAIALYRQNYIVKPGFDKIASLRVRTAVVDMAVLFGQTGAALETEKVAHADKIAHAAAGLEAVSGCDQDAIISDTDAVEINKAEPRGLINALSCYRIVHHAQVVKAHPARVVFIEGWDVRACGFIE